MAEAENHATEAPVEHHETVAEPEVAETHHIEVPEAIEGGEGGEGEGEGETAADAQEAEGSGEGEEDDEK